MDDSAALVLLALALAFAVVNGVNDGAALVATGLKVSALPPLAATLLLGGALVVAPLLLGTAVATTLANQLVAGQGGVRVVTVAVVAAMAVVALLTRLGLPTSLTLALIGALAGAGLGLGEPVAWSTVAFVLAIGLAAPLVGGFASWLVSRASRLLPVTDAGRAIRRAHGAAFGAQCLAYASNDGQKMLAVAAVALGTAQGGVSLPLPALLGIAALFVAGVAVGLPRVARTLGDGVLPVRPQNAVAAELGSAGSVLASAAVGAPVSMTQAVASGIIGSGISESYRRVRWRSAAQLALAWLVTLPAALLGALAAGALVEALS